MFNNITIEKDTVRSYARGIAGGLLFATPLLFTMEMWWLGFSLPPEQLLIALLANFLILLILEHYSGFRDDTSFVDEIQDAIVAQGLGIVVAAIILSILNLLRPQMSLAEAVGKLIIESIAISIGISVAMSMFGQKNDAENKRNERRKEDAGFWGNQAIALAGAIYFGLNIAPTEEPMMVGLQMHEWQSLILLVLSILLVFAITYALEFRGGIRGGEDTKWHTVLIRDSVSTYTTALLCAVGLLALFGRINPDTGLLPALQMTIALGFTNCLGASAARLLI